MKKLVVLALATLILVSAGTVFSQSRRVSPATSNTRPNVRTPSPTPTPDQQSEANVSDSGDFESVNTELVTVPVRALDRNNRFVGGLTKDDFKIFEDGVQQDIAYFTNEEQPFTVALVLDMSYSTVFKISEIQAAAIEFIDQLRPQDKVIVVSFDEEVHMLTEATSDRGRIYRAIRSTRIATGTSLYDAVDLTMNERLRSIKGRKAMVLFTDGVDTTSRRSHDLKNLQDAMELDALIYPIRYDTFADVQAMKSKTTTIFFPGPKLPTGQKSPIPTGNPIPGGIPVPATPSDKGTTAAEYAAAEEYLNKLALNTGGRIYLASSTGSLSKAFSAIASELREFYSIGFEPKGEPIPGKTRKIKVRTDKQGIVIRARDSYVVPKRRQVLK